MHALHIPLSQRGPQVAAYEKAKAKRTENNKEGTTKECVRLVSGD